MISKSHRDSELIKGSRRNKERDSGPEPDWVARSPKREVVIPYMEGTRGRTTA